MEKKYTITTDPHFYDQQYGITATLSEEKTRLHGEITNKKNPNVIDLLSELITKYPEVPIPKNNLAVAY